LSSKSSDQGISGAAAEGEVDADGLKDPEPLADSDFDSDSEPLSLCETLNEPDCDCDSDLLSEALPETLPLGDNENEPDID